MVLDQRDPILGEPKPKFAMRTLVVQAAMAAVLMAGCFLPPGPASPSGSTTSTTTTTMEFFSGTLGVKGSSLVTFEVVQAGTVTVTINSVGPSAPASVVGLGLGIPSVTGTCNFSITNPSAIAASAAQITVTEPAGQYCVEIYDVGNLTTAEPFAITIRHS